MDEAGSRVHIANIHVPQVIEELERSVEEIKNKKSDPFYGYSGHHCHYFGHTLFIDHHPVFFQFFLPVVFFLLFSWGLPVSEKLNWPKYWHNICSIRLIR